MSEKTWVLLVAGSQSWDNYRHQANVCCTYQLFKKQGIPDEQIVVMMYDNISENSNNPFPGSIRSVVDQTNVHKSVPHDYTGKKVNSKNFLAILRGDDSAGGKIIRSGSNDNILIYMSGAGNNGNFKFPEDSLTAHQFTTTINTMSENKKYSKMAIFMDSDNSKSVFTGLYDNISVYAVASCDSNNQNKSVQNDTDRGIYLSDQFSAAWLTFISTADLKKATFSKLFNYIKSKGESCPSAFGDQEIPQLRIGDFLRVGGCSDCA
ncbi:legumain-like [Danio aesculapii]|uniref:legumain-like n=1 Tax=Danio aesculapii TaxID=1142201 RepID=UPI0024C0C413|nr:legumain-like [Danio aesculapii]